MYFVNFHICTHSYAFTHTRTHAHTHSDTTITNTLQSQIVSTVASFARPLRAATWHATQSENKPAKLPHHHLPPSAHVPPSFVLALPGCCFLLQLSLSLHSETTRPAATLPLASHGFVKSSNANSFQVPKSDACAFPSPLLSLHCCSLQELQQLQSLAAPERSQNVVSNASFACSLHPLLLSDPCTSMQMGYSRAVHMRRMRNIQISTQATLLFSDSLPDCWADNERLQTAAPGLS